MAHTVAFTAVADHGGPVGPKGAITLVFNTDKTNIGGGYDHTSGIFRAPCPGLYFFTFFCYGGQMGHTGLQLIKNGEVIVQSFDDERGHNNFDNSGNSALLHLHPGEEVFVRQPADCLVWASNNTTSFSGFLVSFF